MPCCRAACLISSRLSAFQSHDSWTGCETRQRHKPSNVPRTCLLITVPTAVCFLLPFLPPHWQHRRTVCLSWRVRGVAWASFITGFGINKKIFTRFVAHQKKISYFFSSANDITAIQEKVSTTTWDCFFLWFSWKRLKNLILHTRWTASQDAPVRACCLSAAAHSWGRSWVRNLNN